MNLAPLALALTCAACASSAASWTPADTERATAMGDNALSLETACDRDAGICNAALVRVVERAQVCGAAAFLFDHRQPAHDTGAIRCTRAAGDGGAP
ncbi:MAG TPA: hypothetical protein VIY73_16000 [Polyangiaceae bacterium]